jgi:hypothetical protein
MTVSLLVRRVSAALGVTDASGGRASGSVGGDIDVWECRMVAPVGSISWVSTINATDAMCASGTRQVRVDVPKPPMVPGRILDDL